MKKMIAILFCLMMMGCSSLLVNPNLKYSQETINGITVNKITDDLSLQESYQTLNFIDESTLFVTRITIRTVYDINSKKVAFFFDDFGKRSSSKMLYKTDDLYLRNILFSNKKVAVDMDITDSSSLDTSSETIYELNRKEIKKLIAMLEDQAPVFIRVKTNSREFTVTFKDTQKMLDILKVADYLMK